MEDSNQDRFNKINNKKKKVSASSKDPINHDGSPASLKQYFLYLSEDLLLD